MTEKATAIAVYGSPRNKDHGRPCGCSIRFRGGGAGYDIRNCPTHEAGPDLLAALEVIGNDPCERDSAGAKPLCPDLTALPAGRWCGSCTARAAVDRAKGKQ